MCLQLLRKIARERERERERMEAALFSFDSKIVKCSSVISAN